MLHNVLFNFVDAPDFTPENVLDEGVRFVLDSNKEGHAYYRIELIKPDEIDFFDGDQQTYRLLANHISIYHLEHCTIPELSQFHYTAYFVDDAKKEYRLHVYFNDKDGLAAPPVFSIENSAGLYTRVPVEPLHTSFIDLATGVCRPIIGRLRAELEKKVSELEARYKQVESEACELSETLDHDAYFSKLSELLVTLQQLNPLVSHTRYQSICRFIQGMQKAIKRALEVKQPAEITTIMPDQTTLEPEEMEPVNVPAVKPDCPNIDTKIDGLVSRFAKLSKQDDTAYTKNLAIIFAEINELFLLLEERKSTASIAALKKLQNLYRESHLAGEQLFPRLLLGGHFELIKQLNAFNHLLSARYLNMALQTRNDRLLDFLLIHGNFFIDKQPIQVKNQHYRSAVHCCFELDTSETPMSACLAVLIRHNASLIVNGQDGLPIAHVILSNPDHPLRAAFHEPEAREKTHESPLFYKQLIVAMKCYLQQNPCTEAQRSEILDAISCYESQRSVGYLFSGKNATVQGSAVRRAHADFLEKNGKKLMIEQLERDPDYNFHFQKLVHENQEYQKLIAPRQKRQEQAHTGRYLQALRKSLDQLDQTHGNTFTYEQIKKAAISLVQVFITLCQYQQELYQVQKTIRQSAHTSRKRGRELAAKQSRLVTEINKIIESMPAPDALAVHIDSNQAPHSHDEEASADAGLACQMK